jgi:hypothetical protein
MLDLPGVCPLCALGLPHSPLDGVFNPPSPDAVSDWLSAAHQTINPLVAWAMSLNGHSDLLLMAIGSIPG